MSRVFGKGLRQIRQAGALSVWREQHRMEVTFDKRSDFFLWKIPRLQASVPAGSKQGMSGFLMNSFYMIFRGK
jgi:hypothetical protein